MSGAIFGCPSSGEGAIGISLVETRDAAQHSTVHSTVPRDEELSDPKYQ